MENILLLQHVDSYGARLRMEGISAYAREAGWNVQGYEEHVDAASLAEITDLWHPAGAILGPSTGHIEYDAQLFSPETTVLLDSFPPHGLERFTTVITDSAAATERVARELLGVKCASYGFVPWPNTRLWSENRRHNFAKILAAQGRRLAVFEPSRQNLEIREFQRELVPWLQALPKPCGIYAANDRVGTYVLSACKLARVEVPFDCIIVGVDNNEKVCEGENPTLSSITLDFYGSGYRAAANCPKSRSSACRRSSSCAATPRASSCRPTGTSCAPRRSSAPRPARGLPPRTSSGSSPARAGSPRSASAGRRDGPYWRKSAQSASKRRNSSSRTRTACSPRSPDSAAMRPTRPSAASSRRRRA